MAPNERLARRRRRDQEGLPAIARALAEGSASTSR
jgi:hypothetical protein